jgi:hypothetical protein
MNRTAQALSCHDSRRDWAAESPGLYPIDFPATAGQDLFPLEISSIMDHHMDLRAAQRRGVTRSISRLSVLTVAARVLGRRISGRA